MTVRIRAQSPVSFFPCFLGLIAVLMLQPGCRLGKQKTATPGLPGAIRIAFLPANIPPDNPGLRWVSMSIPVLMAEAAGSASDLEVVPLYESMPVVFEVLGTSRIMTAEAAAAIAARLSAKWVVQGEVSSAGNSIFLVEDFIPAKTNQIAFRYQKRCSAASLPKNARESIAQFLRYQEARPLAGGKNPVYDVNYLQEIGEALDREYGWLSTAEPGKVETLVRHLSTSNAPLARILFNPALYPDINPASLAAQPDSPKLPPSRPESGLSIPPPASRAETAPVSVPLQGPSTYSDPARKAEVRQATPLEARHPEDRSEDSAPNPTGSPTQSPAAPSTVPIATRGITGTPASEPPSLPDTPRGVPKPKGANAIKAPAASETARKSPVPRQQDYAIQVFSSQSRSGAEAAAKSLKRSGLEVEIEEAEVKDKGIWYRIRLRGYPSRMEAEAVAAKLQAEGLIKQYWIVR